jgi:hypothetical protein
MVWSCGKNAKPTNATTNCSGYKGKNKGNRMTTQSGEVRYKRT